MKKQLLLAVLLACFGFGCNNEKHTECPPGFSVVCDGHGRFGAKWGSYVIEDAYGLRMQSRQAAIDRAWDQYVYYTNSINKPKPPEINWQDCEN